MGVPLRVGLFRATLRSGALHCSLSVAPLPSLTQWAWYWMVNLVKITDSDIVQPFIKEISEGEWSFIFFDG